MRNNNIQTLLLSRTDGIGDMVLTLPMAGIIKKYYPGVRVIVLGCTYTKPVVELSNNVDVFFNWDEIVKLSFKEQIEFIKQHNIDCAIHVFPNRAVARLLMKACVDMRIGTSHRWYHWLYCNVLPDFSRKKSKLHESQLNLKLLEPLNINLVISLPEIADFFNFSCSYSLPSELKSLIFNGKLNIILHPLSKGSARNWGLANFAQLIELLPSDKFNIFVSGTESEGLAFRDLLVQPYTNVVDVSGKLSLEQFIALIYSADALIACSTGPLHLASAFDKLAVGLYAPIAPIFPARWAPIGKNVVVFSSSNTKCKRCAKGGRCACIEGLEPVQVADVLNSKLL